MAIHLFSGQEPLDQAEFSEPLEINAGINMAYYNLLFFSLHVFVPWACASHWRFMHIYPVASLWRFDSFSQFCDGGGYLQVRNFTNITRIITVWWKAWAWVSWNSHIKNTFGHIEVLSHSHWFLLCLLVCMCEWGEDVGACMHASCVHACAHIMHICGILFLVGFPCCTYVCYMSEYSEDKKLSWHLLVIIWCSWCL